MIGGYETRIISHRNYLSVISEKTTGDTINVSH